MNINQFLVFQLDLWLNAEFTFEEHGGCVVMGGEDDIEDRKGRGEGSLSPLQTHNFVLTQDSQVLHQRGAQAVCTLNYIEFIQINTNDDTVCVWEGWREEWLKIGKIRQLNNQQRGMSKD